MGFEAAEDDLVDALRLLIAVNVNDVLRDTYDEDPIPTTYGYPVPLDQLPQTQLPALAVYRISDTFVSGGRRQDDVRAAMGVDYFGPPIPLTDLNDCWALLREVWEQLGISICGNSFTDKDGNEQTPLTDAGVIKLQMPTVTAAYSFAVDDGGNAFPFFAGRFSMDTRETTTVTAPPFRELLVSYRLVEDGVFVVTDCDPIVEDQLLATAFDPRAFSSGFSETAHG